MESALFTGSAEIENAFRHTGDLLKAEGEEAAIVVVGGATLNAAAEFPRRVQQAVEHVAQHRS
jgi:major membrane immunogen (membrane-anchored lipoprotein)